MGCIYSSSSHSHSIKRPHCVWCYKGYIVNDTDDVCLSINESVVEVEPLPEVTTLRASGVWLNTRSMQTSPLTRCAAAAVPVQADIESAVQDKKSYSPTLVPETPNAVWFDERQNIIAMKKRVFLNFWNDRIRYDLLFWIPSKSSIALKWNICKAWPLPWVKIE
jgi:hypothetical protein